MSTSIRWRGWLATASTGALVAGLALVGATVAAPAAHAVTIDPDAWYEIVSRHSGKAIDVAGVSTADGAAIQQWSRSGGENQQFRFLDSGGGFYRLQARHSGKVIDVFQKSTADGAQVVQWPDNGGTNQQFQPIDTDSGFVKLVNRNSGKALDVWEWSTADGARISQFTDHGGVNQQWQLVLVDDGGGGDDPPPPGDLVGWATVDGGTTGGAGGPTVTVTSGSQLISEMQSAGPRVIQVQGTITISGMNDVGSDKTIVGLGSNAVIQGGGLDVDEVSNVIIRNIRFQNWDDDAINLQDGSTNVWVDHNTFTNGNDGAVDVKRGSDFVTVSWNHFFNHEKTMLLGHSDGNGSQDIGHLRVTYHHNWFDGSRSRHPRVRFGNPVHVFNNYYLNLELYAVASTMDAGVLVEGNYFQNVPEPTHVGYADSDPGSLVFRNNVLVDSGPVESTSGGVNPIPYGYQLDNPADVPSIVMNGAGAGNL